MEFHAFSRFAGAESALIAATEALDATRLGCRVTAPGCQNRTAEMLVPEGRWILAGGDNHRFFGNKSTSPGRGSGNRTMPFRRPSGTRRIFHPYPVVSPPANFPDASGVGRG